MTEGTSNRLAAKVKARRTRRGWSQEHLASVSGVSERTIRRLEAGTAIASLQTLQALANAFEVDVSEFTGLLEAPSRSHAATQEHEVATGEEFFAALVGAHFLATHVEDARDDLVADLNSAP